MEYNKDLLESWIREDEDCLEEYSEEDISEEETVSYIRDCIETNQRIEYCRKLLTQHKDALIYYTLAILYSTYDFDKDGNILYKKPVRYYCIMAIRKDRRYASAWALLASTYYWVFLVVGEVAKARSTYIAAEEYSKRQKKQIKFIEKALFCVNKAIQIVPMNEEYQNMRSYYYEKRNEIYAAGA